MIPIPTRETDFGVVAAVKSASDRRPEAYLLSLPFRHDQDLAWTVRLPSDLAQEAAASRPTLAVYEDERRLGPAKSMHADIRSCGGGAFAFWWPKNLCFSTSDASDPNTNGRSYTIRREVDLVKNHRTTSEDGAASFRDFVIATYFSPTVKMPGGATLSRAEFLETPEGRKGLADILYGRLEEHRKTIVPWINEKLSLADRRILEIGCGTGSSTLALAEQGAHVVGLDIHAGSLGIAKERCRHYGVNNVEFIQANAADLPNSITDRKFDLIIFFAALEHMTYDERLKSVADCWSILASSGLLCCVDTPNRLWHLDVHTSHLPFFHWLPDQLAIRYGKFSPNLSLRRHLGDFEPTPANEERLIRAGRGVSFHEFELAIGPVQELQVVSCRNEQLAHRLMREGPNKGDDGFIRALMALAPGVHPAWFFARLDLIIEKP